VTRGQTNLVALIAALVTLSVATGIGVAVADSALVDERRAADERHVATALSERLVAASSPLTNRTNVLDGSALDGLYATDLRREYAVPDAYDVRLARNGETLVETGPARDGMTIRRIVLVERTQKRTITPSFGGGNDVSLPRRTDRVRLAVDPANTTVTGVRVNGRVVLSDPDGIAGTYTVPVPRRETVELAFVAGAALEPGDVTVTLFPRRTTATTLEVTVDG
jgi:hypothetical protein